MIDMTKRISVAVALAAFSVTSLCKSPAVYAGPVQDQLGKQALAEAFATAARQVVGNAGSDSKPLLDAKIKQSIALLEAACAEFPYEPRYFRLLADACQEGKDWAGAKDAIIRYRQIQLPEVQNDQVAMVTLIDLSVKLSEDEPSKDKYLNQILAAPSTAVADPVKSHAAFLLSQSMATQLNSKASDDDLDKALQLNPLSPEALAAKFEQTRRQGKPSDQVTALVNMLKSNPAQPEIMATLADTLASVGQMDPAVDWYHRSFDLSQQLGLGLDPNRYLDCSAALELMGQPKKAQDYAVSVLQADASNARAASLLVFIARQMANAPLPGSTAAGADVVKAANAALLKAITAQIGTYHAQLAGATAKAATQASATQPTDLLGTITLDENRLKEFKNTPANDTQTAFLDGYSAALSNLAWYYTYFDPTPDKAEQVLAQLEPLRASDDAEVTRLRGWLFSVEGKKPEAKLKLSAVADRDLLAKMGLIMLDPTAPGAAADASKLLSEHASGLVGLQLADGLRDKGGKFVASSESAAAANNARTFPMPLLQLLQIGNAQKFFSLLAQPVRASNKFGEPAVARITVQNTGDYDLSIGVNGAIKPDLWIDCYVQGGQNVPMSGVAYDRIAGPLVLKAHHIDQPGAAQTIRVDEGALADYLNGNPMEAVSMLFSVLVNPIGQSAGVAPGPGGYRQQFSSPMERPASPIAFPQQVQDLETPISQGTTADKIHSLELLGTYVTYLRTAIAPPKVPVAPAAAPAGLGGLPAPAAAPAAAKLQMDPKVVQTTIASFLAVMQGALRDPNTTVQFWAQYQLALLTADQDRFATAMSLLQGADTEQRVLGLMLANSMTPERQQQLGAIAANDLVNYIKALAQATANAGAAKSTPKK